MKYYEHHLGDYMRACAHLSLLEHGVYRRLLDVYYSTEAPIPAAQAERLVCARTQDERAAVCAVLVEFFTQDGDQWRHARCDAEIQRYREKQDKARKSAESRWNKPAHSEGNADAMRTHSEGNAKAMLTNNQEPRTIESKDDSLTGIVIDPSGPTTGAPDSDDDLPADLLGVVPAKRRKPEAIPCPGQEIADLWDRMLCPEAAAIARWDQRRARVLAARWKEQAASEGWQSKADGLKWFEELFAGCRRSRFLMGKVPPKNGSLPFKLKFDWFFGPENFTRVLEGDFHRGN